MVLCLMSYLISFVFYVAFILTFFLLMPIDIQYIKCSLNQLYNLTDTFTNKSNKYLIYGYSIFMSLFFNYLKIML